MKLSDAKRKYAYVIDRIRRAGYFVPAVRAEHGWDWITCASKRRKGRGYTGIIIYVTRIDGQWYFNTMHPYHYRIRRPRRVASVLTAYLSQDRRPAGLRKPYPADDLIPIEYSEFQTLLQEYRKQQGAGGRIYVLWQQHCAAGFPEELVGKEMIAGINILSVHAVTAGCIAAFVREGTLNLRRTAALGLCYRDLSIVVERLNDGQREYFTRLKELARLVLEVLRDEPKPS